MAILQGFLNPSSFGPFNPDKNQDIETIPAVNALSFADPSPTLFGALTNTQPVAEHPRVLVGFLMDSFDTDYYNNIHILPNPIDLGNVIDGQTAQFMVWNAYFIPQLLSVIEPNGDQGLLLSEPKPTPTDFLPLEHRFYDIVVSMDGPATINASYQFLFPSDQPVLRIFGYRTVLFGFRPNWKNNVIERLEWLTDVIEAYDGSEQLIGLRKYPRRYIEYDLVAHDKNHQLLRALLWGRQAQVFSLPIWMDSAVLTQPVNTDEAQIYISAIPDEFKVGKQAIVYSDLFDYEIVSIETIFEDHIDLVNPMVKSFSAGVRIYPVLGARLVDKTRVDRHNAIVETTKVRFFIDEINEVTPLDSPDLYRDIPVLEVRPNWGRDVTDEYMQKLSILDFETGRMRWSIESELATVFQQMSWLKRNKAAIRLLRQWFYARAGQFKPLWVPTWSNDLTVAQPFNSVDTEIYVKNIGYSQFYGDIGRRDIRIALKDGQIFYRRVSSPQPQLNGTEKISIDGALGMQIDPDEIQMISFMALCRLNSDAVEIAYHTPEIAESTVTMKSLQHDL